MLKRAINTPWKIFSSVQSYLLHPLVRFMFLCHRIPWGSDWRFYGFPIIQKHRQSQMLFGDGLQLRSSLRSNPLGLNHPVILCTWQSGAMLKVGRNFAMSGGALCAAESVIIGNDVAIGANTTIIDTDFHPTDHVLRQIMDAQGEAGAINIADDVFIGMSCLILKGVSIGASSTIGAGSVVTRDIPAGVIAAGNPARIIRELP